MQKLALRWKRAGLRRAAAASPPAGTRIGFVPTMGCLHAGHLSLVKRARRAVGKNGVVVVSIYVNPTQFGPREDFAKYPRDLKRDLRLCRAAGVDVVFTPSDKEMYPALDCGDTSPLSKRRRVGALQNFSTCVFEEKLSRTMEGASRPTHFCGVTTVVAKLFNIVLPDVAVFGAKDWQQAVIIKRMVADLNFPVKITVAPTRREHDGLAMSSRNKYLVGDLRRQATVLWRAIQKARTVVKKAKTVPATKLKTSLKKLIEGEPDTPSRRRSGAASARLDYVDFFEPDTLLPVSKVKCGTHMALAVFVGKTRLIDNAKL